MEPKGSLQYSQGPTAYPYPELDTSSSHVSTLYP